MTEEYYMFGIIVLIFIMVLFYITRPRSESMQRGRIEGTPLTISSFTTNVIKSKDRYISIRLNANHNLQNAQLWIGNEHIGNVITVIKKDKIAFLIVDRILEDYHGQRILVTNVE